MIRILRVIGLSATLVVLTGPVMLRLAALVSHKHHNRTGWTMLVLGVIGLEFIFTSLRAAIRCGGATIEAGRERAK